LKILLVSVREETLIDQILIVIAAEPGVQVSAISAAESWIPAFAGMTADGKRRAGL
jgi:hypothetical protein